MHLSCEVISVGQSTDEKGQPMTTISMTKLIILVFTAVSFVVFGDTAGKLLAANGVAPGLIAWSRFLIAACAIFPVSGVSWNDFPSLLNWKVILRAICISCGILCILTALKTEPIANVFGAFFIGPVVSYILAFFFLKERLSIVRSLFLGMGFLGVICVVKPGADMSFGILFALAAGSFYGAYLVITRAVAGQFRPRFLLLSQLLIGTVLLTPLGLSADVPEMSFGVVALFLVSALGSALGNYMLVLANKAAPASLIAPLVYSQLISATILGGVVFSDWPDAVSLLGLSLIMVSGAGSLMMYHKEYARQKGPQ